MSTAGSRDATGLELRATYRLQLSAGFGFSAARELVPYLRDLGISHLYLSPSLQAREGSTHGYDVVDPTRLSDALGGEQAFQGLSAEARAAGLGIVLDVVPNHMAVDPANRFWADPDLRARFFDIDPVSGRHRRFFDIDDMAGIRIEREEVFAATHELILRLLTEGVIDGLRIDHPDGLADPVGYLRRLRDRGARRVWVEKILASSERLPADWPVTGTVGYEFLNDVCGLFVDPAGEPALSELWRECSGDPRPFGAYALEAKLEQAQGTFRPELERLARAAAAELGSAAAAATPGPAATMPGFPATAMPGSIAAEPGQPGVRGGVTDGVRGGVSADAIALALATLPIYRTYDPPSAGEFITRFQQTSPAIMAKGVEDTAFYRYGRLLALNDVGGDPGRFGVTASQFHAACAARLVSHPQALLTTMTHDAKRSTDVRARIAALAQLPDQWVAHARRWLERSERHCATIDGRLAPDPQERYFILQTLIGAWPLELERLDGYLEKALREAKRHTSWVEPDLDYEQAVKRFAAALAQDPEFLAEFEPVRSAAADAGTRAVLGQLALKLTAPGIPDTYQGDELELRALVDPDNRRPVDWGLRSERLARLAGGGRPADDLSDRKLWLTVRLLGLRARRPQPFAGSYEPLDAGEGACAYLRGGEVLTIVALPRAGQSSEPTVTELPGGRWREALTGDERTFGQRVPLARLLDAGTGVAVYERI